MATRFASLFRRTLTPLAFAAALVPVSASAALMTYSFSNITNNDPADATTGEAQLFVDVTDAGVGANQVAFVFRNTGPLDSSITDIYFDDGSLLGIASIENMLGVSFSEGASPGDLPGGNAVDFNTTAGFLADSDAPTQPNGVNSLEQVKIVFDLIAGQDFNDVISALELALDNEGTDVVGGLRIGIHVQGFALGGSESFVNGGGGGGVEEVPEPGMTFLLGSGLLGLWAMRRRKTAA